MPPRTTHPLLDRTSGEVPTPATSVQPTPSEAVPEGPAPVLAEPSPAAVREVPATVRFSECGPGSNAQIVCADNHLCSCPLAGQVTDAERAFMNDISRSAERLKTVFVWIFALLAVAAAVLVLLR